MPNDSLDCNEDEEFERPSKSLVLTIFAFAVVMKLLIILVEALDFGNYLKRDGGESKNQN